MHERVLALRKHLGLSRAAFGEKLGVSGDVINNIERGRVELKDLLFSHMCSVYNVSEKWLKTGEGEMFTPLTQDEELEAWIGRIQFEAISGDKAAKMKRRLITALKRIEHDETWEDLYRVAEEFVAKHNEED